MLPCSHVTKASIVFLCFSWTKDDQQEAFFYDAGLHSNNDLMGQSPQFKGRVSHFSEELKAGNASITIRNTTTADSGNYSCAFPHLKPKQISHITLIVEPLALKDRSETPGAAQKPHTVIIDATKTEALLMCEVGAAFPKPSVEWRDSRGNVLPAEEPLVTERNGSFYVTLITTVTKTSPFSFRCVVKQESIGHVTHGEIHVPDGMFGDDGIPRKTVVVPVICAVFVVCLVFVTLPLFWKRRTGEFQRRGVKEEEMLFFKACCHLKTARPPDNAASEEEKAYGVKLVPYQRTDLYRSQSVEG